MGGRESYKMQRVAIFALNLLVATAVPLTTDRCTSTALPVLGGIDFVDFENLKESTWTTAGDPPTKGSSQFKSSLNGYDFWFKNQANRDKFAADPWRYAPA